MIQYNTIRYDTIRYDTIRNDTIRCETKRYDTIRYDMIRYTTIQYNKIRLVSNVSVNTLGEFYIHLTIFLGTIRTAKAGSGTVSRCSYFYSDKIAIRIPFSIAIKV